jgi:Transposase, Mutator family
LALLGLGLAVRPALHQGAPAGVDHYKETNQSSLHQTWGAHYLALGVTLEGDRDVPGVWFQESERAKFWMQVLSELKQRGVRDILTRGRTARRARSRIAGTATRDRTRSPPQRSVRVCTDAGATWVCERCGCIEQEVQP